MQTVLISFLSVLATVQAYPATVATPKTPWDGKATWTYNQSPAASGNTIVLWNVQNNVKTTIGSTSPQATSFQYANVDSIGQGVYQFLVCESQICSYSGNFGIKQGDTTFRNLVAAAPAPAPAAVAAPAPAAAAPAAAAPVAAVSAPAPVAAPQNPSSSGSSAVKSAPAASTTSLSAQEAKGASSGVKQASADVIALGQTPDGFANQSDDFSLGNSETGTNGITSTNSSALSGGAIAGIVIGILVLVAGCVFAIFRVRRRRAPEHPLSYPRESRANRI